MYQVVGAIEITISCTKFLAPLPGIVRVWTTDDSSCSFELKHFSFKRSEGLMDFIHSFKTWLLHTNDHEVETQNIDKHNIENRKQKEIKNKE